MKLNGSNRKELNQRRIHGSRTSMQGYVHPAPGTNITRKKPDSGPPPQRTFISASKMLGGGGGDGGIREADRLTKDRQTDRQETETETDRKTETKVKKQQKN